MQGWIHPSEKLNPADYRVVTMDTRSVKCIRYMHDGSWFLSGDVEGKVKVYRSNLEKIMARSKPFYPD